jgi:AraC-like DNA-binding protein
MSILVRVADVPADERVDYLHEVGARIWVPFTAVSEDVSQMEFRASGFGSMQVVMIEGAPFRVTRSPKQIEQADPDLLKAYLVCGGNKSVICQDDRQAMLSRGEIALYDTRRPCAQIQGTVPGRRLQLLTFMFPPSMLPLPRDRIRELVATRIPASPGLGELTSQFLQQLARNVDSYTPAEVARLSTAALEVLATRLARELDVRDWGTPEARKHAMLTTVQGFIWQHLSDPGLTPAAVAAAHHLSLRALHQLFHDEGLTVAGYIRGRRMERCRRDLADPALASRPVAAIAARWGFSSAADFSRAFRAAHGLPPAEYRRSARDAKQPAP